MKNKQATKTVAKVATVGLLFSLLSCVGTILSGEFNLQTTIIQLRRSQDIPNVQERYEHIVEQLSEVTEDTLVRNETISALQALSGVYAGCIRASKNRIYGANRPYREVLDDFLSAFTEGGGWEQRAEGTAYLSETTLMYLTQVKSEEVGNSSDLQSYETFYFVTIEYAEPSIFAYSG